MPSPPKVLIAEDDPSIVKLIVTILKREGCESESFNNGSDAILALEKDKYDLVICDQTMPKATGREVAAWMRKSKLNFDTPFVLVSAEQNPVLFGNMLSSSEIDLFIPKPLHFPKLTSHLRMIMNTKIRQKA